MPRTRHTKAVREGPPGLGGLRRAGMPRGRLRGQPRSRRSDRQSWNRSTGRRRTRAKAARRSRHSTRPSVGHQAARSRSLRRRTPDTALITVWVSVRMSVTVVPGRRVARALDAGDHPPQRLGLVTLEVGLALVEAAGLSRRAAPGGDDAEVADPLGHGLPLDLHPGRVVGGVPQPASQPAARGERDGQRAQDPHDQAEQDPQHGGAWSWSEPAPEARASRSCC